VDEHEVAVELYRTPPGEFVTARKAKVAELRADGQRDLAAVVAKLRRPSPVNWALNTIRHEHPDVVAEWADAAEAGRAAQRATVEGRSTDLRSALAELRRCAQAVVEVAPAGTPVDRVSAALATIAMSAPATDALRAGLLGSEVPESDELFGGAVPATGTTPPRRRRSAEPADASVDGPVTDPPHDARRERLLTMVSEHEAAADLADRALAEAAAALELAEQERAEAQRRFDEARAERADALVAQRAASEQVERATADREASHERLDAARAELADLDHPS
jgi:hypothetical protein